MIRPPPRSTRVRSSAASDVYKRQVVAVPRQHRPVELEDGGRVVFVVRATGRLQARLETLETGKALVTTPEQTMIDLAKRPNLGGVPQEARDALKNLVPLVDLEKVERLAQQQHTIKAWEIIRALHD